MSRVGVVVVLVTRLVLEGVVPEGCYKGQPLSLRERCPSWLVKVEPHKYQTCQVMKGATKEKILQRLVSLPKVAEAGAAQRTMEASPLSRAAMEVLVAEGKESQETNLLA